MRFSLAGIVLLLLIPVAALAQAKGEVESIGFGSHYRPNCWTPMLVRVQADVSGTYQIRIVQEDLDRDHQIFMQEVSLTGAEDGRGAEQRFWLYFIPQPSGLPDTTSGGSLRDLQLSLQVFLCDAKGKQIAQLPVTQTITNLDAPGVNPLAGQRGNRLVLAVSDGGSQPIWLDYRSAVGVMEDVTFITVRSTDLPEDVRGYEMVDAIVWLGAPLPNPARPSEEKRFQAIESFIRDGGHLVVCQPAQRDATDSIAEMLPVEVLSVEPRNDLEPLRSLARTRFNPAKRDDWLLPKGPFLFARARLKPRAVADELKIKWDESGADQTPYIARIGLGLGCVTWVAHDLSDPTITAHAKSGWPYIWNRVLDYRADLAIADTNTPQEVLRPYSGTGYADIGRSLKGPMQLSAKVQALVSIAVVFFIGYWLIAGPGIYFFLLTCARTQWSWFLFGLSALAATLLTVLVVRLVVRGPPDLAHVTFVRSAAGSPDVSLSRFSLYIPRDGQQEIALRDVESDQVSFLTAFAEHPSQANIDVEFPAQLPYLIPLHAAGEGAPVEISVPYRSTAKQFQARRAGATGGTIEGAAHLRPNTANDWNIEGLLTNVTGRRLRDVYFIFHPPGKPDDGLLYLPTWDKAVTIDLKDFNDPKLVKEIGGDRNNNFVGLPTDRIRLRGQLGQPGRDEGWSEYWFAPFRTDNPIPAPRDDLERSFPMMSLFTRLPPMTNPTDPESKAGKKRRIDLMRRGGRYLDCSNVVAAGNMLVLATADEDGKSPLPFTLNVAGSKVDGHGLILYQVAVPLERLTATDTTQPVDSASTQPDARAQAEF